MCINLRLEAHATNTATLTTPPGAAAIAVVRLSGPDVPAFLRTHFSKTAKMGRAVHGDLTDGSRIIDDAVVVLCDATTADLNLHGGTWVVHSAMDLARRETFEVRESPASLVVDADSELEREVLSHLPLARTELGVRTILAQSEAWNDLIQRFAAESPVVRAELVRLLADRTLHHLLHPPTVAIIGVPNVGKSTLANQLFARERSITADVPGTTRDWVGEIANIDGLPVMLVDTPGLRITEDQIEQTAIERSRLEIHRADMIVLLLDASRPLEGEQALLICEYPNALRVANKVDRISDEQITSVASISMVAVAGQGVDELRRAIVRHFCGSDNVVIKQPYVWTKRQADLVRQAQESGKGIGQI
jgi:tRNA modification GTPase